MPLMLSRTAPLANATVAPGDGELVRRALKREPLAEEALFRRYAPALLGTALRLLGRRSEAEDAVQDAFVIALERLSQLRDPEAVRGWLQQIVVSQARRQLRRARLLRVLGFGRDDDTVSLAELASEGAGPDVRAELAAIDRQLQKLPADQRLAWTLRRVEGWPLEEVAASCSCSLATAKRRIAAADEALDPEGKIAKRAES